MDTGCCSSGRRTETLRQCARIAFWLAHRAPCARCACAEKSSDDEEGEHNVSNLFLDVVGQISSGMLVGGFLEDKELARGALCCHL